MASNPVLLCYDGSDDAKCALDRAAELFAGRPCVVLCIWEHGWANLAIAWPKSNDMESLEAAAEQTGNKLAGEGVRRNRRLRDRYQRHSAVLPRFDAARPDPLPARYGSRPTGSSIRSSRGPEYAISKI